LNMQDFSALKLIDYVGLVWEKTFLSGPVKQSWLERLGKCLGIDDTSGWSVYGDYKNSKTKKSELIFLVPIDDARAIGAYYLTLTLQGHEIKNLPIWLSDHLASPAGRGVPAKVKEQLEGCRYYGSV